MFCKCPLDGALGVSVSGLGATLHTVLPAVDELALLTPVCFALPQSDLIAPSHSLTQSLH